MSRYGLCRALLEVRSELSIETDFSLGWVSQREGDYFASLARYDEAKQEYLEAASLDFRHFGSAVRPSRRIDGAWLPR
jgi:hypothetical protein